MIPKKEWARDTLRMLLLLGAAVAVCSVLSRVHDDNNPFAVLIFVLAVAIVALVTNGYVWGVLASVIGVFCVNYMFTYPFWSYEHHGLPAHLRGHAGGLGGHQHPYHSGKANRTPAV